MQTFTPQRQSLTSSIALLIVDAQKDFTHSAYGRGNKTTAEVAEKIAALAPAFREAAIDIYAVHDTRARKTPDFHHFAPEEQDTLVAKDQDSAFTGSDIDTLLQGSGRKMLLVAGFNASGCAAQTALDARAKGYDVCFLTDLSANDDTAILAGNRQEAMPYTLEEFKKADVILAPAAQVLARLAEIKAQAAEMTTKDFAAALKNSIDPAAPLPETLTVKPTGNAYALHSMIYMGR